MTNRDILLKLADRLIPVFTSGFVQNMARQKAKDAINQLSEVQALLVINMVRDALREEVGLG